MGKKIKLEIKPDEKGYFDRECPNENCLSTFKVNLDDWKEKIKGNDCHCPICGHVADSDSWWTENQLDELRERASSYALSFVQSELNKTFKDLERKTRNNKFIKIKYKPGKKISFNNNPIGQLPEWEQEIQCKECGTRYSVIGFSHFCPCCGNNSEVDEFDEALKIEKKIDSLEKINKIYSDEYGKDVGAFFEHYILPNFKDKRLSDITELDCLRFWQYLKSLDKSSGYKNDILGAFKAIFRYACDYYGLEKSPAEKLKRFQKSREEKLRRKNKDLKVWTNEEFNKFINCVDNQMYKALFVTLYYTGMRKGECLALTWKDFKDHKISVEKSLTRKTDLESCYEIKEPKNVYSIRDISLNDSVYDYLLSYKEKEAALPGFSEDWFMFGRLEPIAENTLTRAKDVAINKAGVKRIGIHDFRHSHASNLIANGVNIVAVSKRLGHSDVAMTLSVYTHLLEKNDDELVNNIEENSKLIINSLSR